MSESNSESNDVQPLRPHPRDTFIDKLAEEITAELQRERELTAEQLLAIANALDIDSQKKGQDEVNKWFEENTEIRRQIRAEKPVEQPVHIERSILDAIYRFFPEYVPQYGVPGPGNEDRMVILICEGKEYEVGFSCYGNLDGPVTEYS
jgi:hypothetical protein